MSTDQGASGFEPVPHGVPLPDDPDHTEFVHPEAQSLIAVVFAGLAALLLLLVPVATRVAPMQKGWWVEPSTWPMFTLSITLVAGAFEGSRWLRSGRAAGFDADFRQKSLWAFGALQPALAYSAVFILYLFAVGWAGFALPSFIFLQVVIWMAGLRTTAWRVKAALFVIAAVVVFRVLMGVWFPMAPLYEAFFPDWFVRSVAIYL